MQEEKQINDSGMTLVDFFHLMIKNLLLIITITVAATVVGIIYTFNIAKPTYAAQTDVMVQVIRTSESENATTKDYDVNTTFNLMQPVAEFIQQDLIIEKVIADLDLDITPKELRNNLTVSYSNRSFFVNIKYEAKDPVLAKNVVNKIIDISITTANTDYPVLANTMYSMGEAKDGVYSSPNKPLNVIISIMLGGIIGVVTVLLIEVFHTTVRSRKELESLLPDYQVIGVIPDINLEGE